MNAIKLSSTQQNLNPLENFFRFRIKEQTNSKRPKPFKRTLDVTVKPLTWATAESARVDKFLTDLETLNAGLGFVLDKLSGSGAGLLPSRTLPYISDEGNLRAIIDAMNQRNLELAHCAEIKRDVPLALDSIEAIQHNHETRFKLTFEDFEPGPPKFLVPDIELTPLEWKNKATGEREPVLLEFKDCYDSRK
jgi:hypothetical protein